MAVIFWLSVALIVYAYAGYACALFVLSHVRTRPVRKDVFTPRVSFIIAAHNERARIREKIENTLAQDYPADRLEVLVASDCSTDGTDAIVCGFGERVRLVRASERRGKEAAQRLAIAHATGEIFVFSDAATAIAPDAVRTIVANFADPDVGCVSSVDRFIDPDGRISGEGAYVRYEMWLRELETRVYSLVGLSGSFFAVRRLVCGAWAADRQSDFSTLLNTVRFGLRGVLDRDAVGYYRNIVDEGSEHDRKVRTVVRGISVLASNLDLLNPLRRPLFAWQLASHKLCRWLVPFAMIAALASNAALVAAPFYRAMFAAQLTFYAAAAAGFWTGAGALRLPAYFVRSNLSILAAWIRFARGERMTTWTPSDRVAALPDTPSTASGFRKLVAGR